MHWQAVLIVAMTAFPHDCLSSLQPRSQLLSSLELHMPALVVQSLKDCTCGAGTGAVPVACTVRGMSETRAGHSCLQAISDVQ